MIIENTKESTSKLSSLKDLNDFRKKIISEQSINEIEIIICHGTGCIANGSEDVTKAIKEALIAKDTKAKVISKVKTTGCNGFCSRGPLVVIQPHGIFYQKVLPDDADEIIERTIIHQEPITRLLYDEPKTGETILKEKEIPFYKLQNRVVLQNIGKIDPTNINDTIAIGGYHALAKAILSMTPDEVICEIEKSELRGRGGAGFPTGKKWRSALHAIEKGKSGYVVVNGDEGDPGAFMDRTIMEGDPHAVLEGLIIGAYALGAKEGFFYVRAEYPLAIHHLEIAMDQARKLGLLGKNILNTGFSFEARINRGAGAFVCGESTALVLSIEGKRGMPKAAPRPRTTEIGLFDKPTLLNNVKTFAYVPQIINRGGNWFASVGTEGSKGTAVFALTGMVNNCGLIEVPMGLTIREIIYDIGGGIFDNKIFKAVQIGGPSGGCLSANFLDTPVDYDSLKAAGSMMGSGGMVVMDETTCMVDVARYFLDFTRKESCGQCTLCKLGTKQMLNILEDIVDGEGQSGDIDLLIEIGEAVNAGSLCGLGQSAANPVLTTIKYFKEEYEAHINEKCCPALACKKLISYRIIDAKCGGCTICAKACPVNAITGEKKLVHVLDQSKCIRCGVCFEKCPKKYRAVECIPGHLSEGDN